MSKEEFMNELTDRASRIPGVLTVVQGQDIVVTFTNGKEFTVEITEGENEFYRRAKHGAN